MLEELEHFIGVVTKLVVERHLIAPLPTILDAIIVTRLKHEEVAFVAPEPDEVISRRRHLENEKEILKFSDYG